MLFPYRISRSVTINIMHCASILLSYLVYKHFENSKTKVYFFLMLSSAFLRDCAQHSSGAADNKIHIYCLQFRNLRLVDEPQMKINFCWRVMAEYLVDLAHRLPREMCTSGKEWTELFRQYTQ